LQVKAVGDFENGFGEVVISGDDLAVALGVLGRVGISSRHLVFDVSLLSGPYQFMPKSGHMSPTPKIDSLSQ
tara:strand:- start:313 stop:528 length:216 start_codon:yes stop_codon:yes gene_type:complete